MLRGDEAAGSGPFCWKPATDSLASAGLRSQVGNTQARDAERRRDEGWEGEVT